jgi:carbamoyltransferase
MNSKKARSVKGKLAAIFNLKETDIRAELHNIEHHRSHIASSFFASRFEESAILSIDGFGDFTSTMSAVGNANKFEVLDAVNYPHSLGILYTTVTQFLGFPNYGDEYKVMGLASYGQTKYLKELEEILELTTDGFFKLNRKYFKHFNQGVVMEWENGSPFVDSLFTKNWESLFGKSRGKGDKLEQWHIDLATSVQRFTENVIFHMLNHLHAKTGLETGLDNICITEESLRIQ